VRVLDLDLDLDFFLYGTAHYADSANKRPDADEYPPWPLDVAIAFLPKRCQLNGRRPGFVVQAIDHRDPPVPFTPEQMASPGFGHFALSARRAIAGGVRRLL
jgi:hypothetical protein